MKKKAVYIISVSACLITVCSLFIYTIYTKKPNSDGQLEAPKIINSQQADFKKETEKTFEADSVAMQIARNFLIFAFFFFLSVFLPSYLSQRYIFNFNTIKIINTIPIFLSSLQQF